MRPATRPSQRAARLFASCVVLLALGACTDDDDKSKNANTGGAITDGMTRPGDQSPGKPSDAKPEKLERPGQLSKPPTEGQVPAELRPPRD